MRVCCKCGKIDKRRFGGMSYVYPERDSGLCEVCFKKINKTKKGGE